MQSRERDGLDEEGVVVEKVNPPAADQMGKPSQPSLPFSARQWAAKRMGTSYS